MFTEGIHKTEYIDNAEIHNTNDGEYTALLLEGKRFTFSYGRTKEAALQLAKEGMKANIAAEEEKSSPFSKNTLHQNNTSYFIQNVFR